MADNKEIPPSAPYPPPPYTFLPPSTPGEISMPAENRTPQPAMMPPNHVGLENYMKYVALSIFTTCCCCPLLGVAAFLFSTKAHHFARCGDVDSAYRNSQKAWILNVAAVSMGLSFYIGFLVFRSLQKIHFFNLGGGDNKTEDAGAAW